MNVKKKKKKKRWEQVWKIMKKYKRKYVLKKKKKPCALRCPCPPRRLYQENGKHMGWFLMGGCVKINTLLIFIDLWIYI